MARIALLLSISPGSAEVIANFKTKKGDFRRLTAVIDTGAAVSLLPENLMEILKYTPTDDSAVVIEQAGIAQQAFDATEAIVTVFLEDFSGAATREMDIRVWFAPTNTPLIGFADMLDRATLHIDMRARREGWIETD